MAVLSDDQQTQAMLWVQQNSRESMSNFISLLHVVAPDLVGGGASGGGMELDDLPTSIDTYKDISSLPAIRWGSRIPTWPM